MTATKLGELRARVLRDEQELVVTTSSAMLCEAGGALGRFERQLKRHGQEWCHVFGPGEPDQPAIIGSLFETCSSGDSSFLFLRDWLKKVRAFPSRLQLRHVRYRVPVDRVTEWGSWNDEEAQTEKPIVDMWIETDDDRKLIIVDRLPGSPFPLLGQIDWRDLGERDHVIAITSGASVVADGFDGRMRLGKAILVVVDFETRLAPAFRRMNDSASEQAGVRLAAEKLILILENRMNRKQRREIESELTSVALAEPYGYRSFMLLKKSETALKRELFRRFVERLPELLPTGFELDRRIQDPPEGSETFSDDWTTCQMPNTSSPLDGATGIRLVHPTLREYNLRFDICFESVAFRDCRFGLRKFNTLKPCDNEGSWVQRFEQLFGDIHRDEEWITSTWWNPRHWDDWVFADMESGVFDEKFIELVEKLDTCITISNDERC